MLNAKLFKISDTDQQWKKAVAWFTGSRDYKLWFCQGVWTWEGNDVLRPHSPHLKSNGTALRNM